MGLSLTGASVGGAIIPALMMYAIGEMSFLLTMLVTGGIVFCVLSLLAFILTLTKPELTPLGPKTNFKNVFAADLLTKRVFWRISIAAGMALAGQVGFLAHQIPIALQQTNEFGSVISVTIVAVSAALGRLITAYALSLIHI